MLPWRAPVPTSEQDKAAGMRHARPIDAAIENLAASQTGSPAKGAAAAGMTMLPEYLMRNNKFIRETRKITEWDLAWQHGYIAILQFDSQPIPDCSSHRLETDT